MRQTLLFFTLLLTACSPRYEIKTNYILPTDSQGKVCVQNCSTERKVCQRDCNKKQDDCLARAKQSAKENFPHIMSGYKHAFSQYQNELHRYHLAMDSWSREMDRNNQDLEHYQNTCSHNHNNYECNRANELKNVIHSLENDEPLEPKEPIRPSLATEIQHAQKTCSNNCGCADEYNSCFSACGGTVSYEKFCVENCK